MKMTPKNVKHVSASWKWCVKMSQTSTGLMKMTTKNVKDVSTSWKWYQKTSKCTPNAPTSWEWHQKTSKMHRRHENDTQKYQNAPKMKPNETTSENVKMWPNDGCKATSIHVGCQNESFWQLLGHGTYWNRFHAQFPIEWSRYHWNSWVLVELWTEKSSPSPQNNFWAWMRLSWPYHPRPCSR